MTGVLVAGIGNILLGDDGVGSDVARRLRDEAMPDGVRVVDYGIGGIHLAHDLLDPVDLLVLVDAVDHGQPPGTVSVIEVGDGGTAWGSRPPTSPAPMDSHAMDPATVLANVVRLGGSVPPTMVVGVQPERLEEGLGLTAVVEAAVGPAMAAVRDVIDRWAAARDA